MSVTNTSVLNPISYRQVDFPQGFWKQRQDLNRSVTLKAEYEQLEKTGRIASLSHQWQEEDWYKPHHYWDSDIAKWIEAAAYVLGKQEDREIEEKVDHLVELMRSHQLDDGYFNTYFSTVGKGKRWTNVYVMHELYCAGHLIEAAVAYYEATGKDAFLTMMSRYTDHILSIFGPEEGKMHGYPGHEEIELALVKLYRATKHRPYLELAAYFINERGKQPHFFELEALGRGEDPDKNPLRDILNRNYLSEGPYASYQAHKPVREQTEAVGHAVRAMYLYTAMADVAGELGDESLLQACRNLWKNVTQARMSITGGIGALEFGERFTFDYDLPNESVYNETCASIGLIFWAHRMLQIEKDSVYADVMEQTLYNGVISGISLTGDHFFYSNHLACQPELYTHNVSRNPRLLPQRQSWFEVSCCPPNLARLTASLGQYLYSTTDKDLYVHLYTANTVRTPIAGNTVELKTTTDYPWDGKIFITIGTDEPLAFTLHARIPTWCKHPSVRINGKQYACTKENLVKGYLPIERTWNAGDELILDFPMEVRFLQAHPAVRHNTGRVAVARGPMMYCFEEVDNGKRLQDVVLDTQAPSQVEWRADLLGGVQAIRLKGASRSLTQWEGVLYQEVEQEWEERSLTAIPYYTWSNRALGEMIVWIRST
nr:beta-L-arabinofuranosidase domain-containing protein [uncultured Sphaerochaeta sp.]